VKDDEYWNVPNGDYMLEFDGFNYLFDFITYEDEKPWSIEDLKKLSWLDNRLKYDPADVAFKGGEEE